MSHSKNKVWVHGVFSTKYRNPLIIKDVRQVVYENLHRQLKKTGCYMESVGGIEDHVHLLFLLSRSKTLAQIFQQIKGASSYDFNQEKLFIEPFIGKRGMGHFPSQNLKFQS